MSPTSVASDASEAIRVARSKGGQIASLILPADSSWGSAEARGTVAAGTSLETVDPEIVKRVAKVLKSQGPTIMLLGGAALRGKALVWASRIANKTGCKLMSEGQNARLERGAGRVKLGRLPYDVPGAVATLKGTAQLVMVGAKMPVAFFAYPDQPSLLVPPECEVSSLAQAHHNIEAALEALALELDAVNTAPTIAELQRPALPSGKITPEGIAAVLAALIPEQAIVVDESISMGRGFFPPTSSAAPHDWMNSMGASLGYALPVSIGAAIAAPSRRVIAVVGDGSAMYTPQALWSLVREGLNVTVVILANRSYNILRSELTKVGVTSPGRTAIDMLSLTDPSLDWVALANGHGMPASRAENLDELARQLR